MLLARIETSVGFADTDDVIGKRVELGRVFHGLTAMLFDHGTARCADGEFPMDVVEGVKKR